MNIHPKLHTLNLNLKLIWQSLNKVAFAVTVSHCMQ
jgi:hypothetical protein